MSPSPSWPADFLDAHERYWEDGERLFGGGRRATADHLYGLSAECGLKALMVASGMPTDSQGNPAEKKYWIHVDQLWDTFLTFAQGRILERYVALLPHINPFGDWSVWHRYANRSHFAEGVVQAHRSGAHAVRRVVTQAQRDGLLT